MIRRDESVFVDTGAWVALALANDPFHQTAREEWASLRSASARIHTSIPVVIETFTFLDRKVTRDVALIWRSGIRDAANLVLLSCEAADLELAWPWMHRTDLHKLSLVDATSFAIMKRLRIGLAFSFDHHFAMAGFRLVG